MTTVSTLGDLAPATPAALGRRRLLYSVTTLALSALMFLGVTDALGWTRAYGVSSATVSAADGARTLRVVYPATTRPALASPFRITVTDPQGFDRPITIGIDRHYLEMWDVNGWYPAPSSERANGALVEMEFDPPPGSELVVAFDARIEPAVQQGRDGKVILFDGDEEAAIVHFGTAVRP